MTSLPVIIYCTSDVPRLRYIAGLILGDVLGLKWKLVTDKRRIGKNPVINYSGENISNAFKINPVSLLFEKGITDQEINVKEWNGLPIFFANDSGSDFPFDIFAASFFLVTRYEEYLDFVPDEYGRFKASSSLAFKNGFLQSPVIDLWIMVFAKAFLKKFPILTFKRNEYRSLLTVDADYFFESHGISFLIGGLLDFKKNESSAHGDKDNMDVINYILENIKNTGTDTRFFFAVGKNSRHDHNPSWKNERYRYLINNIAGNYETGLHPSFNSASNFQLVCSEKLRLEKILAHDVLSSRIHYVKLNFPHSYKNLFKAGIKNEYSMGYPDEPGFRAGIARPFYFYDVVDDDISKLKIIPFLYTDNLFNQFTTKQMKDIILKLINETRKAGGVFVSSWHLSSLSGREEMKDRREVFEFMLKNQVL